MFLVFDLSSLVASKDWPRAYLVSCHAIFPFPVHSFFPFVHSIIYHLYTYSSQQPFHFVFRVLSLSLLVITSFPCPELHSTTIKFKIRFDNDQIKGQVIRR